MNMAGGNPLWLQSLVFCKRWTFLVLIPIEDRWRFFFNPNSIELGIYLRKNKTKQNQNSPVSENKFYHLVARRTEVRQFIWKSNQGSINMKDFSDLFELHWIS